MKRYSLMITLKGGQYQQTAQFGETEAEAIMAVLERDYTGPRATQGIISITVTNVQEMPEGFKWNK